MIIRYATKEDVTQVSGLWVKMVNEIKPEWTPNREWWEKMILSLMDTPTVQYTVVVAQDGDNIVGFIDGMIFPEPSTGKIHGVGQHFYIMPEYRHTTTAGRLYGGIVSHALKNKTQVLDFFCSPDGLKFWNKRGYGLMRCMVRREINIC